MYSYGATLTVCVFGNTGCRYFDILGFSNADGISVFAVLMSFFALLFNLGMIIFPQFFWDTDPSKPIMKDDGLLDFIGAQCTKPSPPTFHP